MLRELKETATLLDSTIVWINDGEVVKTEGRKKIVLLQTWNESFTILRDKFDKPYYKMIANAYKGMISNRTAETLEWSELFKFSRKILRQISKLDTKGWC